MVFPAIHAPISFIFFSAVLLLVTAVVNAQAQASASTNLAAITVPPEPDNSSFDACATGGWGGACQRLVDQGITINAQWLLEGFDNFQGGINTRLDWASTFDLSLALDTEKAFNWSGGKFFVDGRPRRAESFHRFSRRPTGF